MAKTVLIIGGGFAGIEAAKSLARDFQVTMVDFKEYFEFTPGVLRALLQPQYYKQISVSYKDIAGRYRFRFIKGEVVELDHFSSFIKTADQEFEFKFDYCLIACGGEYFEPIKPHRVFEDLMNERAETVNEYQNELEDAKSVLIMGGGPVAVELAAEIISAFPDKKVLLANHTNKLLRMFPKMAQLYVQNILKDKGVEIRLNTRIEDHEAANYDLVFKCVGIMYKAEFLRSKFGHLMQENGRLSVNPFLQVTGNIFAAGDIADSGLPLSTTAFVAEKEGALAAKNITAMANRKNMTCAQPLPTFYCLSLGPNLGVTILGDLIVPGRLQVYFKDFIKYLKLKSLTSDIVSAIWRTMHSGATWVGLYLR